MGGPTEPFRTGPGTEGRKDRELKARLTRFRVGERYDVSGVCVGPVEKRD